MPCNDITSRAIIRLDEGERLVEFDFSKITCGGKIGSGTEFGEFCKGISVDEILKIDYESVAQKLVLKDETASFLLYLEWSALLSALAQYKGLEAGDQAKVASVEYNAGGVEIHLTIKPLGIKPKRIPSCAEREGKISST